jgi:hypothetical protein
MRTSTQKQKPTPEAQSAGSARPGRAFSGQGSEVSLILQLQRSIGNQAVARLLQAQAQKLEDKSRTSTLPRFGHDFSRIPVPAGARTTIQEKLQVSIPGDTHEQQADRIAEQVMHMPEPQLQRTGVGCPKRQNEQAAHEHLQTKSVQANDSEGIAAPSIVHEGLHSSGQPLDPSTRAFMEPRFGHDFSWVRVHTGTQAAESAQALQAQAYTIGHNVVFAYGQYSPHDSAGKRLLAHELAHVVQQSATPKEQSHGPIATPARELSLHQTPEMISRKFISLGYRSWVAIPLGQKVVLDHKVGSEDDWREVLKKADNEETYRTFLQGFLELAINPNLVEQSARAWATDFKNSITRAPTYKEIMAFLRALYGLGDDLDLNPNLFAAEFTLTKWPEEMKTNISEFIDKYQGEWIKEISGRKPGEKDIVVDKENVEAVASEGGIRVSNSMINNGIHSSEEGVAKLLFAVAKEDERGMATAYNHIRNAAYLIRYALNVRNAKLKEAEEMKTVVLDIVFADILQIKHIPGAAKLIEYWPTVMDHLKNAAFEMAEGAIRNDKPEKQATSIASAFINHIEQFGPNGDCPVLDVHSMVDAENAFDAGLGIK